VKVAITGAASGIGAATAARLASRGDDVLGIDLRGVDVEADLGSADGRRRAIDLVTDWCNGALDGLVTCAGLAGLPDRAASLLVSVNYFGTVELLAGLRGALAAGTEPAAVAISSNSTTTQPGIALALVDACLAGDEAGARAGEVGPPARAHAGVGGSEHPAERGRARRDPDGPVAGGSRRPVRRAAHRGVRGTDRPARQTRGDRRSHRVPARTRRSVLLRFGVVL
jgi:hypothetical protein